MWNHTDTLTTSSLLGLLPDPFISPNPTNAHSAYHQMRFTPSFFAYLTNVTLSSSVGATFEGNRAHRLAKVSARTKPAKQASSLRYIAAHCPLLTTFTIEPYLRACTLDAYSITPKPLKKVKKADMTPLILALVEMVKKCKGLCTITSPQSVVLFKENDKGERQWEGPHWFSNEVLELGDVDDWLREDVVHEWAEEL
jgi:hypothetical protein